MKNLKALLLLIPFLFTSCVKPISLMVNYSEDPNAKGTVTIVPSRPIASTSLTMNGKLLVEHKYVKKITAQNVPDGTYSYHLTGDNSKLKEKIDTKSECYVQNGEAESILVETPPISNGYWIQAGVYSMGLWIALAILFVESEN